MLAKSARLRTNRDISAVYKRGQYAGADRLISVKVLKTSRPATRAVVVVPKKVDKRAVVRNRIRRRILGYIQSNMATLRPGYDIVISVHSDVSDLQTALLQQHLVAVLTKTGVLQK